jgi:hypothetical protein
MDLLDSIKVWQEAVVVFSLHRYDVLHDLLLKGSEWNPRIPLAVFFPHEELGAHCGLSA